MMKHTNTETTQINFSKLEERIMAINNPILGKFNPVREMLYELTNQNKPTLIMATGGSKVVAYYLQLIIERLGLTGIICEIIEPRDYFYKTNRDCFSNLIAISAGGNTNGIKEVLTHFKGRKYLICENEKETDYEVISWENELYQKEKSFISLATSLGPITLLLDSVTSLNLETGFNIYNYPNNPGYPGAFVRRSGISEDIDGLLNTLKDVKDRSCRFLDCLTFYDGRDFYCFFGSDEGIITYEKRGTQNKAMRSALWYVFKPKDSVKTLAEMTDEERINRKDGHISAKEQFIEWYKKNYVDTKQLVKK